MFHLNAVASAYKQLRLIVHCRYSTSGDWKEEGNNQPIVIGDCALAFNGVIRMSTKDEWGKEFGFKPVTDNDGEIFVRKVLDGEDWNAWVAHGAFSFAGVMLHGGRLIALRNKQRPLWHNEAYGCNFIASTADIFNRIGLGGAHEVPAGQAVFL